MALDVNNLAGTAVVTFSDEFDAFRIWDGVTGWDVLGGPQWPGRIAPQGTYPHNGELQWYVNPAHTPQANEPILTNPFSISDGVLSITARPAEPMPEAYIWSQTYTSGMINTQHAFAQTYGYFEMRAQVPAGRGLWPAFWLLPSSPAWPPEIDVMEVLGHDTRTLYTHVHSGTASNVTSVGQGIAVPDLSAGFHTYGVDWGPSTITWYFDGRPVYQTATPADMHGPMYMIVNLAVGGLWPGSPDAATRFPASFKIDYVRAYAARETSTTSTVPETSITVSASFTLSANALNLAAIGKADAKLVGNALGNTIKGNAGKNMIEAYAGDDKLYGGYGNDVLYGGTGRDVFVFDSKLGSSRTDRKVNFDTIKDYRLIDDAIWLDNKIFAKLGRKGSETKPAKLNKKFFTVDTKAQDTDDYLVYNKKTGILSYDKDGSGPGQAIEVVKLPKNLKMTYHEFYVV